MTPWHTLAEDEILQKLKTGRNGLSLAEAEKRLGQHGANTLPKQKSRHPFFLFLEQFQNPLIYIVLGATITSFVLRHFSDSIFIGVVLLINAVAGFLEEYKAEKTIEELIKHVQYYAKVVRGGEEILIETEKLVPGDIIKLQNGDRVPADARLIEQIELAVDEAPLTGESMPVQKTTATLTTAMAMPDHTNMVYAGTLVKEGVGLAVVTSTGGNTELGKIVLLVKETKKEKTPLQKNLYNLSVLLGWMIVGLVIIITVVGFWRGQSLTDMLLASLALAVSTIPEGLLPAITIILVLGMRRILNKKALIKKLQATETLGAVTVIATDKTGTLTLGEMQVVKILTSTKELLHSKNSEAYQNADLESHLLALKIAALLNTAFIENQGAPRDQWVVQGKPTDKALFIAALEAGLTRPDLEKQFIRRDYLPFDSSRKYSAGLFEAPKGLTHDQMPEKVFLVLGAPEIIFAKSSRIHVDGHTTPLFEKQRDGLNTRLDQLTSLGLRVLACAWRPALDTKADTPFLNLMNDLNLVGFIILQDPLRKEAKQALATVRQAGIRPIMVTGDHALTAKAIASELDFRTEPKHIIVGQEIDSLDDEALKKRVGEVEVFARISPKHKIRIVEALRARGEIIAMTGDGTNDAPALRGADVGIALGAGTDVAKEVADIILLDNNFATITSAIEEGRTIFENIKKLLIFLLADDFSEIILFVGAIALGLPLPLLPAQILWINLVEDGFPNLALTTEKKEFDIMAQPPRRAKDRLINRPLGLFVAAVASISGLFAFGAFYWLWQSGKPIEEIRTTIFVLMTLDSLLFAYSVRAFRQSIFRKSIFDNHYLNYAVVFGLLMIGLALYWPLAQKLLLTTPLSLNNWILVGTLATIEILLIEIFKRIFLGPRHRQ